MGELDAWRATGRRALRVARLGRQGGPLRQPPRYALTISLRDVVMLTVLAAAVLGGTSAYQVVKRDEPETYREIEDHFKYGSIGSEAGLGIPYWLWLVLPQIFPQYLPDAGQKDAPGEGYARLGFVYEAGHARPIGTSIRETLVPMQGLNCAMCHVGTVQQTAGAPPQIILGMPAHQFNFEGYLRFLFASVKDDNFSPDVLIPAIQQANPRFSWLDAQLYRYVVIPRTRAGLLKSSKDFSWIDDRPPMGPGRVDTFARYKQDFGLPVKNDVGTVDLPALWNQRIRRHMWLHWDGNNNSVDERNISAALGSGATDTSLDRPALQRVADWISDLQPPAFPEEKINMSLVQEGRLIYQAQCLECHSVQGRQIGQVVPIAEIGTDPERLNAFTTALAEKMNTFGTGQPWKFSHFRKTNGYTNMPLDGIWLRGPFLHNGSVPTLRDLLTPPDQRPAVFYTGYSVYNYKDVGFVTSGPDAERNGHRFDTRVRGNGNGGHTYGTTLSPQELEALLEYLKTQ